MSIGAAESAEEKRWREEEDVRILTEAAAIKKDQKRMQAAVKRAKIMLKEQQDKTNEMRAIAKMRSPMKK
ncbi:MAG: hypothetical protein WCQ69_10365 [Bacteroidales bacterium]|jgi:F0F1-type ATP synthase epsilon subunit